MKQNIQQQLANQEFDTKINEHDGKLNTSNSHYSLFAETAPANDIDVGIAAHTDFESFTLLYQDQPGLELRGVDGHWYTAPQDPNSFVVILGEMMERWTNGWLQATGHRVPRTPWARRSIVMFFAADADCIVSPMPEFVSKSNPARFAPVTQHAYIKQEWDRASALRDDLTN
jgi:isopenicillin N synthase-like dioxygenase